MTYYILIGDSEDVSDHNILGEVSFKNFHAGIGFNVLKKIINNPNAGILLDAVKIKDSNSNIWPVENFLDEISKYNIIVY
jgi:hypothetical protein